MRTLRFTLAGASLVATTAFASPTAPTSGVEYITLASPQPVQVQGKKVEVIEFFMYHSRYSDVLEPYLGDWVKKQGDNIVLKRVPLPYYGPNDPEAHLYLTLEAMGKLHEMHAKVFGAIRAGVRMSKDEIVLDWVAKNGIDKSKFLEYWNSFGVLTKLKRLDQVVANYKVNSAPSLVVGGRYMTSPSMVDASNTGMPEGKLCAATVQVLDALVAKGQKEKRAAKKSDAK